MTKTRCLALFYKRSSLKPGVYIPENDSIAPLRPTCTAISNGHFIWNFSPTGHPALHRDKKGSPV